MPLNSLIVIVLLCKLTSLSLSLSYNSADPKGPQNWGLFSPNCNGRKQSPVNINWHESKPIESNIITLTEITRRPTSIKAENDGHGVKYSMVFADRTQLKISGGPLGIDLYKALSFHFHWKSEHTFNNKHYDAEMQVVFVNSMYESSSTAISRQDGLAVLGFFFAVMFLSVKSIIIQFQYYSFQLIPGRT